VLRAKLFEKSRLLYRPHYAYYYVLMSINETFTANEIMDILIDIGVEVSFESAELSENSIATITCEIGEVSFWCTLLLREPFFEACALNAFTYKSDNPFVFANQFSEGLRIARAVVDLDDDGLVEVDEDGEVLIVAKAELRFNGGITRDHLRFLMEMWIEDLFDFYELEIDIEDDEASTGVEENTETSPVPLLDQVTACLSDGVKYSAREISRLLGVDRQMVNPILYRHREIFERDNQQPPHWSLR